jgi:hypothetical protein
MEGYHIARELYDRTREEQHMAFHSGAYILEDPERETFKYLRKSQGCYSRISSHLKELGVFQPKMYGIDIPPLAYGTKAAEALKRTILFASFAIEGQPLLFLKPEEYGTKGVAFIGHAGTFVQSTLLNLNTPGANNIQRKERVPSGFKEKFDELTAELLAQTRRKSGMKVVRQGYLVKRAINSKRNWRKRFFVIEGNCLLYYKSSDQLMSKGEKGKSKGCIVLSGDCIVEEREFSARKSCFELIKPLVTKADLEEQQLMSDNKSESKGSKSTHVSLLASADSEEELQAWCRDLRDIIECARVADKEAEADNHRVAQMETFDGNGLMPITEDFGESDEDEVEDEEGEEEEDVVGGLERLEPLQRPSVGALVQRMDSMAILPDESGEVSESSAPNEVRHPQADALESEFKAAKKAGVFAMLHVLESCNMGGDRCKGKEKKLLSAQKFRHFVAKNLSKTRTAGDERGFRFRVGREIFLDATSVKVVMDRVQRAVLMDIARGVFAQAEEAEDVIIHVRVIEATGLKGKQDTYCSATYDDERTDETEVWRKSSKSKARGSCYGAQRRASTDISVAGDAAVVASDASKKGKTSKTRGSIFGSPSVSGSSGGGSASGAGSSATGAPRLIHTARTHTAYGGSQSASWNSCLELRAARDNIPKKLDLAVWCKCKLTSDKLIGHGVLDLNSVTQKTLTKHKGAMKQTVRRRTMLVRTTDGPATHAAAMSAMLAAEMEEEASDGGSSLGSQKKVNESVTSSWVALTNEKGVEAGNVNLQVSIQLPTDHLARFCYILLCASHWRLLTKRSKARREAEREKLVALKEALAKSGQISGMVMKNDAEVGSKQNGYIEGAPTDFTSSSETGEKIGDRPAISDGAKRGMFKRVSFKRRGSKDKIEMGNQASELAATSARGGAGQGT